MRRCSSCADNVLVANAPAGHDDACAQARSMPATARREDACGIRRRRARADHRVIYILFRRRRRGRRRVWFCTWPRVRMRANARQRSRTSRCLVTTKRMMGKSRRSLNYTTPARIVGSRFEIATEARARAPVCTSPRGSRATGASPGGNDVFAAGQGRSPPDARGVPYSEAGRCALAAASTREHVRPIATAR